MVPTEDGTPLCECHGKPKRWMKDSRTRLGGFWTCRIKRIEFDRGRREQQNIWAREKYDRDPVYRITKRLRDDRRQRLAAIARHREAV